MRFELQTNLSRAFFIALLTLSAALHAEVAGHFAPDARTGEPIGHGDGRIHVIPSLSRPSLKNGEKLTISAIIKAQAGVASVTADIGGLETITLKPSAQNLGGVNALGTLGMWSAEWTGHGLEEKYYTVALKVVDKDGHEFEDKSLQFSDPIAGLNTPGTTNYPNISLQRTAGTAVLTYGEITTFGVIDLIHGYAYFVTQYGAVLKVNLGAGNSSPTRVGSISFPSDGQPVCGVVDANAGYAYFGTNTSPGNVVKIALGAGDALHTRVGALALNAATSENDLRSAVIDPGTGYAYFGTNTSPGTVVKVALGTGGALPTRVGAVTLPSGENSLSSAVIDTVNGYAYFGTNTSPGKIVKIALGTGSNAPARVGALTLSSGFNSLLSAVIDQGAGYAYFGTGTNPGIVVKVALGTGSALPTFVNSVTLNSGEGSLGYAVIDPAGGFAYFGVSDYGNTAKTIQVALGAGNAPPTRSDVLLYGNANVVGTLIDTVSGYYYFATYNTGGNVVKAALNPSALPTVVNSAGFNQGDGNITCGVIDTAAGFAYFGTDNGNGATNTVVIKVALGAGNSVPTRVGSISIPESPIRVAVIDAGAGYAYFGAATDPGVVVKVALGAGSSLPTRVAAATLQPGEGSLGSAVIDTAAGYAYFSASGTNNSLVKVALGTGSAAPTRIGALTLGSGELIGSGLIDAAAGYAYFGTDTSPGIVLKVALGSGIALPTRIGAITLGSDENRLRSAVIDPVGGYAYFGTYTSPGIVIKVALGSGVAMPTRIGSTTLDNFNGMTLASIDTVAGNAHFVEPSGNVLKISLGTGATPPMLVSTLTASSGENNPSAALIDVVNGFTYLGTSFGTIVKLRTIVEQAATKASRFSLLESAVLVDAHFYSNVAGGNVRLGLYDNSSPRQLLWQSASVPNVPNGSNEIVVPISAGTPQNVSLNAGTYWLAWQVDTSASIPSYTPGGVGDGFNFTQHFGAFAGTLGAETISSERWTEYVTYNKKPNFVITGSNTLAAGSSTTLNIIAKDSGGNVLTTYTGAQSLVFSGANESANPVVNPTAEGVAFGATTPVTFTNGNGVAVYYLYKAEAASISVVDSASGASTITPLNIAVSAGTASKFSITGPTVPQNAGTGFSVTITAQDPYGNTATSCTGAHTLTFSGANSASNAPSTGGVNFGTSQSIMFTNGVANIASMILYKAESASIDVSDGTITASPKLNITVLPLSIAKFAVAGSATQVAGTSQNVAVTAQDTYGNIDPTYAGVKSLVFSGANSAPNSMSPTVNGISFGGTVPLTFTTGGAQAGMTLYKVETAAVTLSSGGFSSPTPLNITVTAGSNGSLNLTGNASQSRGVAFNVSVSAFDIFGNANAGYTGTVTFTSSDSMATLPASYPFVISDAGSKSFALTLNTGGNQVVTVSDGASLKSLFVNVAGSSVTPSITWTNPADITALTPLSSVQLNATANVPGIFTYMPPAGTQLNVGQDQPLSVTFTPSDNSASITKNVSINVNKGIPTLSWFSPSDIAYPTPLSSTQLNASANVPGAFVYSPVLGTVLSTGNSHVITVQFTPNDLTQYNAPPSKSVSLNVVQGTPIVSWLTPADLTLGTALDATQLNATANVSGSFVYSPASGVILGTGNNQPLTAQFTPDDTQNYTKPPVRTVFINVSGQPRSVLVTLGQASLTSTYDGTPKLATATATDPLAQDPNKPLNVTFNFTYNGLTAPPTNAGTYDVVATVVDKVYVGMVTGKLTIKPATAIIFLSNQTQAYDGTAKTATISTSPSNLSVLVTYGGLVSAPTAVGDYTIAVTVNDPNYTQTASDTLHVVKGSAGLVLGSLTQYYDGAAKPVTAVTTPANLTVAFTYGGNPTAPTAPGTYAVVGTINDTNYAGTINGNLVILPSAAGITMTPGSLTQTYDGTAKTVTATTVPANLTLTYTYNGSPTPPVNAGTYAVVATVVNSSLYQGNVTSTLVVSKAAGQVSLQVSGLTSVYDGTQKSVIATTTPQGLATTITYNGSTIPPRNPGIYSVVATINDANYAGSASGNLTIKQGVASVALAGLTKAYNGTPQSVVVTTDPPGLATSVTYNNVATAPTDPGIYVVSATVVDPNWQNTIPITGNLTINSSPPAATGVLAPYAVSEGGSLKVDAVNGALSIYTDPNIPPLPLQAVKISNPRNGTLVFNSTDGSFTYTPNKAFFGSDSFTYQASNGYNQSDTTTVTFNVSFVNSPPSFVKGPDQSIRADAGPQTVAGWATSISAGPPNKAPQVLTFVVQSNSNSAPFSVAPAVSATGVLSYTPNPNASGQAVLNIVLKNNQGTDNGGVDTSPAQTLTIKVAPAPPVLPASTTTSGMALAPFKFKLTASGGVPISYATTGALPAGLSLNADTISGTPAVEGSSTLSVTATNSAFPIGDMKPFSIVVVKTQIISTAVGTGTAGSSGDSGPASSALLSAPSGVAQDGSGNIFVADTSNGRVRRVDTSSGTITSIASGLNKPSSIVTDAGGTNIYICEQGANRIALIDPTNTLSTYYSGTGTGALSTPTGVALDPQGNLYIADSGNKCVRKIAPDKSMTVLAGLGTTAGAAADNGLATAAQLNIPYGVACDLQGNVYIADKGDHVIRKVDTAGKIFTVAGQFGSSGNNGDGGLAISAQLFSPQAVAVDAAGNIYIADSSNRLVREIQAADGIMVTLAGKGTDGDGKPSYSAVLNSPASVSAGKVLLVADSAAQRIRRISVPGKPTQMSDPSVSPSPSQIGQLVTMSWTVTSSTPVTYIWDFGDGSKDTSGASSVSHTYSTAGTYNVSVTATDQTSQALNATVPLVVKQSLIVPEGIVTEIETLFPADAAAILPPVGDPIQPLGLSIPSLSFNFNNPGKDMLSISVNTTLAETIDTTKSIDMRLALDIGGIVNVFELKSSGKGYTATPKDASSGVAVKIKSLNGKSLMFTAAFKNGTFAKTLQASAGLKSDAQSGTTASIPCSLLYGGHLYQNTTVILYSAKGGVGKGKGQ